MRLRFEGTFRPAMSPIHGDGAVRLVVGIGTFVECHDNVCTEVFLNGYGLLRREAVCRAINMTLKGHAVVIDLARLRQRKDLKAPRIGEHGAVPLHELMQAAHVAHEFITWTQVEMIGVTQYE